MDVRHDTSFDKWHTYATTFGHITFNFLNRAYCSAPPTRPRRVIVANHGPTEAFIDLDRNPAPRRRGWGQLSARTDQCNQPGKHPAGATGRNEGKTRQA